MNKAPLLAAGAIVLLANGFALTHAARNRQGEPEADVVVTGRELPSRNYRKENSGVELFLVWQNVGPGFESAWLNRQKLSELGFDCSMDPSWAASSEFYQRQQPRRAFAAFEYDGPAWAAWDRQSKGMANRNPSHLMLVDAATDAIVLRRRHPDRHSVLIFPVAVRIGHEFARPAMKEFPALPPRVLGYVEVSTSVHVPRPYSGMIPSNSMDYRVHLRVGSLYDPWVAGIEPGIK